MLRKIKNKKAQAEFSPAVLIAVVVGLLLFAPIMIRIIGVTTGTFFTQMNSTSPTAVAEADKAVDKVYNFFDYLIIIGILINIILLFISAWFIDTNPVFIILFIMFAFIFVIILPSVLDAVDSVWDKMEDVNANDPWRDDSLTGVLKFSNWIRQNLMLFTIIIIAIAGIITYAKFKIRDGVY
jgi:hypothetical protein